jgi:hypothetical protein
MRLQTERRKREADGAGLDGSNRAGHSPAGPMTEALAAAKQAEPEADMAAEADRYALAHRKRAALIRGLGRLPDNLNVGPMSPALLRAIVRGDSPVLRSLDRNARQPNRLAA